MKTLALFTATALLAACSVQVPRTLSQDVYLIDTEMGLMCHVTECYYLDLIHPSWQEIEIALAYGLPADVYSWSTEEFLSLLLSPPNDLYRVEKLSDTEYSIPRNQATESAFNALDEEDLQLYRIGGEGHSY
ncbi:hypothetical protein ACFVYJ_08120 [Pontibacter sp. JAM-7]|uniref:hypothetical protein n=1 Tax=Pontibacter sp. JAM-7 TaxID=3366581 RepID=UPI003AF90E46